jgi:aspartate/methionine/tyrosine aminotransferase
MIYLNIGEPDFTAPPQVQEAAARAIREGRTQYTQATGLPSCASASAPGTRSASAACRRAASSSPPAPRPRCSWPAWR